MELSKGMKIRILLYSWLIVISIGPLILFLWNSNIGLQLVLISAVALIGICVLMKVMPEKKEPAAGHCERCDYDLQGNATGYCPECGLAIMRDDVGMHRS